MSRLRTIPQSGPEKVARDLAVLRRQVASLIAQQVRQPQRVHYSSDEEVTVTSVAKFNMESEVFVPSGGGLVLVAWNAIMQRQGGSAMDNVKANLTCDAAFPSTGTLFMGLDDMLVSNFAPSLETSPPLAADHGISAGMIVDVEPGTRTLGIELWATTDDLTLYDRNLWLVVL